MGTRWTPLAALVAVLAAVLAGAGVVAAVVHEDEDDRPVTEALGGADVTTTTAVTLPETTTSTTAAPPETTTTSPPTTTARTTTTRRTTTTTTRRTTTTTASGGSGALCAAEQIQVSARPERLDYPAGQPVTLRTTLRNRSSSPCTYNGYTVTMTFLDRPGGATIVASAIIADDFEDKTFAPGASFSHSFTWDPKEACRTPPCSTPPPGIYSTQTVWAFSGGRYEVTQDFVLR